MTTKFVPSALIVALVGIMVVGGVVQSATDATVTATVTVQNVQMTLSQTDFEYGTMSSNTASSTLALFSGAGIIATNTGNVNSDFDIYGANTGTGKSGNGWDLLGTTGTDEYVHKFCNDTDNDCTLPGGQANYSVLTTSPGVLKNTVTASGAVAFQLQITTPNPSTKFTVQSVPVTVQISAS